MSGHSKWNNIKRKKEKTDSQRAKIFTKIGRELSVAVRDGGGPDPSSNSKLRDCIAKAKANNVPNDNISRIIKKAAGDDGQNNYESISYEGYGPNGVAVIVETLTDNRNRTAGNLRHYFDKYGGNLGTPGCVSFMFSPKGVIVVEKTENLSEEKIIEDSIDCGASDVVEEDDCFIIFTDETSCGEVSEKMREKGYTLESSDIEMTPDTYIKISDDNISLKMRTLLDIIEDDDDVQNVWHNWDE